MVNDQTHIPGGEPVRSLLGKIQLALSLRNDMVAAIQAGFDQYGDIYRFQVDDSASIVTRHPEHIHQVLVTQASKFHKDEGYKDRKQGLAVFLGNGLVTSDGEFWRRQRKLIQPMFHAKKIEAYAETMVNFAEQMADKWRDGQKLQVENEMLLVTLDIVAKTIFDLDVRAEAQRIGNAMYELQNVYGAMALLPMWVPTPMRLRAKASLKWLNDFIYGLIQERRAEVSDSRGDLLSMLLAARDDEGKPMTDEQVRDEAVTLIMAGHETTANALNWTWLLLAQNPDAEAKLHAELDAVLGGRAPTLADLPNLPYTEMVIKEAMRLYPPVPGVSRVAIEDVEIGGYTLRKGTVINLFQMFTHHDPKWWDQPEKFIPERFTPEAEKALPRYAYLPFAGGPRVCIGNSFAMMEARLILATLAQRFRLKLSPGQVVKPETLITLRPKGGLPMIAEARVPERRGMVEREKVTV